MSNDSNGRFERSWMRLSDALADVMSAPFSESDAKRLICNAIADRKIEIQLELGKRKTRNMTARGMRFSGADIEIPVRLAPEDLDFENSRPVGSWYLRRERNFYMAGRWEIAWIELDRAGVTKLIKSVRVAGDEKLPRPRRKAQPAREGARRAIAEHFHGDIPDQVKMPNVILCKYVGAKLKELGLPDVSDDTILRAAGRRK
jgi:hypothetical protein